MGEIRIAISGKSGCGNTTVSRLVAERLDIGLINYTFHTMADEHGVSFNEMCRRAESDDTWDRYLDREQIRRAREKSCVLGSRLAIWFLDKANLKIYLAAPLQIRAARIQQREGGSIDEILSATNERDRRDRARFLRLYNIDIESYSFADLIVDSERYTPEEIVDLIVTSLPEGSVGVR